MTLSTLGLVPGSSLYDRLGGAEGIHAIVEDIWTNHMSNPGIAARYIASDPERIKQLVRDQFGAATGGPESYTGQDMLIAHRGMNISEAEFMAVLEDVLAAMSKHGIGQREQDEVLVILFPLRKDIIHV